MSQIFSVLSVIKTYWLLYPDYTLGEILTNASLEVLNDNDCSKLSDEELVTYLRKSFIKRYENVV